MCKKIQFFSLLLLTAYLPYTQQRALDAKEELFKYGFLDSPNPNAYAMKKGIEKFQKVMGLEITGSLNEDTLVKMSSPRCGMPSNRPKPASSNKWRKSELTYKIRNWTEPFALSHVKKVFEDSITTWTENVNLRITESSSDNADINAYFTTQDGPEGKLGYAYFPEDGGIYFDKSEDWTLKSSLADSKIYFAWVAAHEIGHSLGLDHSKANKSIMFAHYSETVLQPSNIDVNNLKRLYGQAVVDRNILCEGAKISAMLKMDDNIIIQGKQYWTISGDSLNAGPFPLDSVFPELPDSIDAAFAVRKTVYFLKDNIFYKFKSNKTKPSVKLISTNFEGVPSSINAAFFDPSSKIIYFFKGSKYYALNTTKSSGKRLIVNGKSIANDWNGIPNDVEAAASLGTDKALFIKDSRCYRVHITSRELLSNQDCRITLFKCC